MKFKPALAAVSGNFIEWYDFGLYFFIAPILAQGFFPEKAGRFALLGTLSMHAVSFFFRPLGAALFGHIGDVYGRKIALQSSLFILAILSIVMACLPTYHQVGWLAPVLLCCCRIGQGISIGGEFAGSMVYLTESSTNKRQSFWSSMSNNGSNLGVLFASFTTATLSAGLGDVLFASYGYRLLFLFGGIISLIGLAFRSDLLETPDFQNKNRIPSLPLTHLFKHQKKRIVQLFLIIGISAVGSYGLMGSLSIFLQQSSAMSYTQALRYQTLFISISLVLVPFFAYLADKISPKSMLQWSCWIYVLAALHCFYYYYAFNSPSVLMLLVIIYSMEQASSPAFMSTLFPAEFRYTAVSMAYNCSMAVIGGLTPLLTQISFSPNSQSYALGYLLTIGSVVALFLIPKISGTTDLRFASPRLQA